MLVGIRAPLSEVLPPRAFVLAAIGIAHVGGFLALAQSRMQVEQAAPTTVAVMIPADSPAPEPMKLSDPLRPVTVALAPPALNLPVVESPVRAVAPSTPKAITVQVAAAEPAPSAHADVPVEVQAIEYLREPRPRYPHEARKRRRQGVVLVRVLVDRAGKPSEVRIERSSGHADLDEAAREAVRRAMFKPHLENGEPRMALAFVPIEFSVRT